MQLELAQRHGASGWNDSPFPVFYELAKTRGWTTLSVECGHDVMLDRPEELTSILLGAAATTNLGR